MSAPYLNPQPFVRVTPKVIIFTTEARFPLGQIVATPPALALLAETRFSAAALLQRHVTGDWGDLCAEDAAANEFAVDHALRTFSVYRLEATETVLAMPVAERSKLRTLWIITEADGSSTCLLTPGCY